jgi:hypothetical protein
MSKICIVENQVYFSFNHEENWERNTQPIKEALMREAVKQCDCYCTDLLIFFDYTWKDFLKGDITEVTLYFRQMGIEWQKECKDCRSKAILQRDVENDKITLNIEYGRV